MGKGWLYEELFSRVTGGAFIFMSFVAVVISGIGFRYFDNEWVFANGQVNTRVMFACGIGVTILLFLIVVALFIIWERDLSAVLVLVFLVHVLMFGLYMGFTAPSIVPRHMESFDAKWDPSLDEIEGLQWNKHCCGWNNAADRGMESCPDDFDSGCARGAAAYLETRAHELFASLATIFVLLTVSLIAFMVGEWTDLVS
jgi:hypothetical protein